MIAKPLFRRPKVDYVVRRLVIFTHVYFEVVLHCHTRAFAQHHIYLIMSRCNASQSSSSPDDSHHSQLLLQSASNNSNIGDVDNSSLNSDGDSSSADENKNVEPCRQQCGLKLLKLGTTTKWSEKSVAFRCQ
jgi:hypothetical protein